MSSWAIVALVAIVIWGIVESIRARAGHVRAQEFGDKEPRLLQRGLLERVVELVVVVERGRGRGVQ